MAAETVPEYIVLIPVLDPRLMVELEEREISYASAVTFASTSIVPPSRSMGAWMVNDDVLSTKRVEPLSTVKPFPAVLI